MVPKLHLFALLVIIHLSEQAFCDNVTQIRSLQYVANITVAKGACPKSTPNPLLSPPLTVRRGGTIRIQGFKDNRLGGFVRLSLVPVGDMFIKEAHDKYAFHYMCADSLPRKCTNLTHTMCSHNNPQQHYSYFFTVPGIFVDGIYVLAVARYGSFPSPLVLISGIGWRDYYSCTPIRIQGGEKQMSYVPKFTPGRTVTGKKGFCRALFNDLKCAYEPCFTHYGPVLLKPAEFTEGKSPEPIMMQASR